ncbi:hypothetical protein BEWA_037710 [Theileria equi strain WA]|uniref:Vacuolar protein sorting-associated protein 28 homolog n=1 Tax=Theileria equi strain WA TaxID=1537102 RepID=L1LEM7_THEEQ|nr:hypothetical protein BEWA_037710 [Theileria equi strain WA]EKX73734.1 hypothetical protein BEWA_037710 [Theileria equi strain WA]|eukprot:XP_004833186.1 hypothetical protein BEWA_037710 [Theileria equi strain WA]
MASTAFLLKDDPSQAADLYSLLYALEYLERGYIGGYSPSDEYETECKSLLSLCKVLNEATPDIFVSFSKEFSFHCPLALNRIKVGQPATLERPKDQKENNQKLMIFELSEHFITLIDALKLGSIAVDELYPLLHSLILSISSIESSHEKNSNEAFTLKSVDKLQKWDKRLEGMGAHEELSSNDARQLSMDTEAAYTFFKTFLRQQQ